MTVHGGREEAVSKLYGMLPASTSGDAAHRTPAENQSVRNGEDVIIAGSVPDGEAKQIFNTWRAPRPYLRLVPQPGR